MRFNKLTYLYTDKFDDIEEIKFMGDFKGGKRDILTVELWVQDGNINVVIMDNVTNEMTHSTDKEEKFALEYATRKGFI